MKQAIDSVQFTILKLRQTTIHGKGLQRYIQVYFEHIEVIHSFKGEGIPKLYYYQI